jgi:pyruvate kinase
MPKYIAVVNPKMDEDDITRLIRKGIAGALFEISHQNYPVAAQLIELIQRLSRKYHRPISIIQDVSSMEDPLDMQFGLKSGVDWVATDKHEHVKLAKGLDKLAGVIFKGRNLPKNIRVDSVLADDFLDPDAEIIGGGHIKHMLSHHPNQMALDSIMHIADHADSSAVSVNNLELAKGLSFRRPKIKIIYAPNDQRLASKAAIYKGVHPIYLADDLIAAIKEHELAKKGDRVMDATDPKHIEIHLVP